MDGLTLWAASMAFRDVMGFLGLWLLAGIVFFFMFQGLFNLGREARKAAARRRTVRFLLNQDPPDFEELARITKNWRQERTQWDLWDASGERD